MSAIYGAISFSGNNLKEDLNKKMSDPLKGYKIDRTESVFEENVLLGCGIQYFTEEAKREQLPYRRDDIYITADCYIDNREELLSKLGFSNTIPDGDIIFEAYKKWGEACTQYLMGSYAFAIYDALKEKCYLYADHASSRTLYYYYDKASGQLAFSTLLKSIKNVIPEEKKQINEKMFVDVISCPLVTFDLLPEETPYVNIFKLTPGAYIQIDKTGLKKVEYWNPLKNRKTWKASREEYERRFFELLNQTYHDILRTNGEIGLTLSGGLDSTSVAAAVAPILQKKDKKLFCYTAVPECELDPNSLKRYEIGNERPYVEEFSKQYSNLVLHFESYPGKTCYSESNDLLNMLEIPYNYRDNLVWLNEIFAHSHQDNCQILLSAFSGNATISSGQYEDYLYELIRRGRIRSFIREQKKYCKAMRYYRKRNMKRILKTCIRAFFHIHGRYMNIDEYAVTKEKYLRKYRVRENYYSMLKEENSGVKVPRIIYAEMFDKRFLSTNGEYITKFSLKHHCLCRDPYIAKTMIEFFVSLPTSAYVGEGIPRYFVRHAFDGKICDKILWDLHSRGIQGADWILRLSTLWDKEKDHIFNTIITSQLMEYIDKDQLYQKFCTLSKENLMNNFENLQLILQIYISAITIENSIK